MAWVRTGTSLATAALIYLRYVPGPPVAIGILGGSTLIGAVGIIAISHRAHRCRSDDFGIGRSFPGPTRNSALVLLVATLAISAGILVLASL